MSENKTHDKLFVYGTLKRDQPRNDILSDSRDAKFMDEKRLKGLVLYDTGNGYPAVLFGDSSVHGEVYEIKNKRLWEKLDKIEGVPTLYTRKQYKGLWIYMWNTTKTGLKKLSSGKWNKNCEDQ